MHRILLVAIAAISTTAAHAAPAAGTATLAAPASVTHLVGESGSWNCTGTACTGTADSVTSVAVAACTNVVDKAGRVAAFSVGSASFAEAELARCNRHIK